MDPFAVIEDFFSAIPLHRYRKYILAMLKSAGSNSYWQKEDPGSLLYVQKKISDLMGAAKKLQNPSKKPKKPQFRPDLAVFEQEMLDPGLYLTGKEHKQWAAFPRNLSKKEFLDPYLAFTRFFRRRSLNEWQRDLEEIVFYALSPHSCAEDLLDLDLLRINELLQKLVEAAHLIMVREINADEH